MSVINLKTADLHWHAGDPDCKTLDEIEPERLLDIKWSGNNNNKSYNSRHSKFFLHIDIFKEWKILIIIENSGMI